MVCTFVTFSSKQSVLATNYDVVIETTIDQSDYKVVEIDNTTGTVNFYEFTPDGDPILDGNNDQTTFVPGDTDFEDRMGYIHNVVIASPLTITSTSEFALPIFVGDGNLGDTIIQVCYDGDSSTDYRVIQHNSFDAPFTATSVVGTFAYMVVGETSYTGFRYDLMIPWDNGIRLELVGIIQDLHQPMRRINLMVFLLNSSLKA